MIPYATAVAGAGLALSARLVLNPVLQDRAPFLFYFLAIVASGCLGGAGPALLCTFMGAALGQFFILGGFHPSAFGQMNLVQLALFLSNGIVISLITEAMRRAIDRERAQSRKLAEATSELGVTEEALNLRERRLDLLARISNQLVTTTDPRAVIGHTCHQLATEMNAELFANFLATPDGYGLELANYGGFQPGEVAMLSRFASAHSLSSVVAQRRQPLVIPDLSLCTLPEADYMRSIGVKIYAAHPLIAGGRLIGTLSFASRRRPAFGEDDLFLLRTACDQIAAVLERMHLFEERLESQRRLQTALEAGRMGSWDLALDSKTLVASTGCKLNFGRSPDESFTYEQLYSAILPEDRERWLTAVTGAAENGAAFELEFRALTPERAQRIIAMRGSVERDETGRASAIAGISMEVTKERVMEALMSESEARWRELAESMSQLVWTATPSGHCDFLSRQWIEYTGVPADQQLGIGWMDAIHPSDRNDLQHVWKKASVTGEPYAVEYRIRRHDGVYRWFISRAVAVRDREGRIKKWYGSDTDIETLKSVELAVREREEQIRLITEHAPVFLAQADLQHRYRFTNRAYAARYGCQPEEIIGRPIAEVVGPRAYQAVRGHMDAAIAGRHVEFETELSYDQLGERWVHIVFAPDRNGHGQIIGFLAVLTDITLRKRTENELKQARDEALDASRAKDVFLSTLSHELRTPLNPVLLLASDALQNPNLPAEVRADFETIIKNVSLEARLIDDLLDLTRISRGKVSLDLQSTDAHALLHTSAEFVQAELESKELHLHFQLQAEHFLLRADPVRLQQIFWNLLRNAIKFTPQGGEITVRSRDAAAGSMLIVEITDTGIGLSTEEIARIFETFSQGNHAESGNSERYGGLGLGLSICKLLVQLHDGRITASSAGPGLGSTFTVELPVETLAPSAGPRPGNEAALLNAPASAESLRILLVEDHESTRRALSRLLERRGHQVIVAATGADAIEQARQSIFDVVISDLGLPDITGYALMNELRRAHGLRGIALSGYGSEQDVDRSLDAGFLRHLTKPVDMKILLETLAQIATTDRNP